MAATKSFWDYIKAAFSAKPKGMFVPPNWVGLAAIGLLGLLNPGIWLIGAGLEVGYLLACANNKRFRKVISAGADAEVACHPDDAREVRRVCEHIADFPIERLLS